MDVDPRTKSAAEQTAYGWKRLAYLSAAGVLFVLGGLGALLPGLPATPFLLLTSYFLVRSSPRLNARLLESKFFGPILVDWQVNGGVQTQVKLKAIVVVVLTVALSLYLSGSRFAPKLAIIVLALVGIAVIIRLPQPRPAEPSDSKLD